MKLRSFWPAIIWTVIILLLSFMSGKSFPSASWMDWFKLDKWIHAFLYFTLFILGFLPLHHRDVKGKKANVVYLILFCFFLGVFTEVIQELFLEDRSGDLPDMVANSIGVFFGVILVRIRLKKWPWKGCNEGTVVVNE